MIEFLNRRTLLIGNILLAIPLFVYCYGTRYIRYIGDDFCVLNTVRDKGVLGSLGFYYASWTGRFVNIATLSAALLSGFTGATLIVCAILTIWWIALFNIVRLVARSRQWAYPGAVAAQAASLLILAMLNSAFNVVQSVYWLSGILLYLAPIVLLTLYLWLILCQALDDTRRFPLPTILLIGAILTFLAAGYSEMYGVTQAFGLAAAYFISLVRPGMNRLKPYLLAGLVGSFPAVILTIIAPGNFVRLADNPRHDIVTTVLGTTLSPAITAGVATLYWPLVPIALIALPILFGYYYERQAGRRIRVYLIWIPIGTATLIAVSFVVNFYITLNPPPERAWVIPEFILFSGLLAWSYVLGWVLRPAEAATRPAKVPGSARVVVMIFWALIVITSINKGVNLTANLSKHAAAWDQRDATIRVKGNATTTLVTLPLPNVSGLQDVLENSDWYVNKCVAVYYGIASIKSIATEQ